MDKGKKGMDPAIFFRKIYETIRKPLYERGFIAGKSGRHMKFPYTLSAKIAQFPLFFYMNGNIYWMTYPFAILAAVPVFYQLHVLANSPENKKSWEESKKKGHDDEH